MPFLSAFGWLHNCALTVDWRRQPWEWTHYTITVQSYWEQQTWTAKLKIIDKSVTCLDVAMNISICYICCPILCYMFFFYLYISSSELLYLLYLPAIRSSSNGMWINTLHKNLPLAVEHIESDPDGCFVFMYGSLYSKSVSILNVYIALKMELNIFFLNWQHLLWNFQLLILLLEVIEIIF